MLLLKMRMYAVLAIVILSAAEGHGVSGRDKAWTILHAGVKSDNTGQRAAAIGSLSLVAGNAEASKLATTALNDPKPEVRSAAATTLGRMHVAAAIPKLRTLLNDEDLSVTLAAAHALSALHDSSAYEAYYAVLTGERKGKGLFAQQLDTLRDPKKMATLGISEGVSFIPFAAIGWDACRNIRNDDTSGVRAAAASMLADDPDPDSVEALKAATMDKSWLVRVAALEALGKRKDPSLLGKIELSMYDDRSEVRYTAAALVIRLSALQTTKRRKATRR